MSKEDLAGLPKEISLDRLVEACKARNIDVHQVIAEALSPEMRLDEKSGMNMREQALMSGLSAWIQHIYFCEVMQLQGG